MNTALAIIGLMAQARPSFFVANLRPESRLYPVFTDGIAPLMTNQLDSAVAPGCFRLDVRRCLPEDFNRLAQYHADLFDDRLDVVRIQLLNSRIPYPIGGVEVISIGCACPQCLSSKRLDVAPAVPLQLGEGL